MAGAPWFDTTLPRIGSPEALVSHWSRLIDLPLAILIGALSPIIGPDRAELATRIAWPALLFFALALVVAREAHRRAGTVAAVFAIVLVATSAIALAQFRPGRMDHHNAQILCAVIGLLFLLRSLDDRRAGAIAGVLLGLGLAVGYEAIALVVPALTLTVLASIWGVHKDASNSIIGVGYAAATLAGTLFVALVATVPPSRWLEIHCDALSLNLVVLATGGAMGVWAAIAVRGPLFVRLGLLGLGAAVGAGLFAGLEPACLAGPFGQTSAALKSLWLDHVMETKSIFWLGVGNPASTLAMAAFVLAGAAAQIALWWRQPATNLGLAAVIVELAALLGCWQIKLMPYAAWLAAVPLAVWAANLRGTSALSPTVTRLMAVVLLSQATMDTAFGTLFSPFLRAVDTLASAADTGDPRRPCFRSANVQRLAALPEGLVIADIDLGPYVVALSPHRVVAAPYHRLDKEIIANEAIMRGTPEQARRGLQQLGVRYVALCADYAVSKPANGQPARFFGMRLLNGERFGFLQELNLGTANAIRVWQVEPAN